MFEKNNRKIPKIWRGCQIIPTTNFANLRHFFTVVEIRGISPTAEGNFVKLPTTKESCRGLLKRGSNCENKIRGTVWTFLQLTKYK